jgi:hypothetical protein
LIDENKLINVNVVECELSQKFNHSSSINQILTKTNQQQEIISKK